MLKTEAHVEMNAMSIQVVSAEQLAELFFHCHQALQPDFGCNKQATSESWDEMPQEEKNCAVAAARLALLELGTNAQQREDVKRYFAKPGEAEWGC